nr:hypothetical protein [Pandoravirus massiliensis]
MGVGTGALVNAHCRVLSWRPCSIPLFFSRCCPFPCRGTRPFNAARARTHIHRSENAQKKCVARASGEDARSATVCNHTARPPRTRKHIYRAETRLTPAVPLSGTNKLPRFLLLLYFFE